MSVYWEGVVNSWKQVLSPILWRGMFPRKGFIPLVFFIPSMVWETSYSKTARYPHVCVSVSHLFLQGFVPFKYFRSFPLSCSVVAQNVRKVQILQHLLCPLRWSDHWRTGQEKQKGQLPAAASDVLIHSLHHLCKQEFGVLHGTRSLFSFGPVSEGIVMRPRDGAMQAQHSLWHQRALMKNKHTVFFFVHRMSQEILIKYW